MWDNNKDIINVAIFLEMCSFGTCARFIVVYELDILTNTAESFASGHYIGMSEFWVFSIFFPSGLANQLDLKFLKL